MLQSHSIYSLHPTNTLLFPSSHYTPLFSSLSTHHRLRLRLRLRPRPGPCLVQSEDTTTTITVTVPPPSEQDEGEGPIELPSNTIFATTDEPTTLQVATSVLLTGAITVFLFRSIRRRAQRAKELFLTFFQVATSVLLTGAITVFLFRSIRRRAQCAKELRYRSTGVKKSFKEEALENLKAVTVGTKGPPSALQTFLGGIAAGVITLILYKFTTTIEAALNRQALSDSFSARQISITVRTIINGLCYLATCVFGVNSLGLFLLSAQLAFNSFMEGDDTQNNESEQLLSSNANTETSGVSRDMDGNSEGKKQSENNENL